MIKAIFFSRFHLEKGPLVLHQVPEGSVKTPNSSPNAKDPTGTSLFDFASVSDYIIPRQELCNRPLSICINGFRILGFPVCITDPDRYVRNEYIFNCALVIDEDEDPSAYAKAVRGIAQVLREAEEQDSHLSREEALLETFESEAEDGLYTSHVHATLEMIRTDLNTYGECMVPIDDANTITLKLFPTDPPPPPVRAWHVPLSIVDPSLLMQATQDLTVLQVLPYIDGANSIAKIARLANADLLLTQRAIAHLVFHDRVLLLDIFQFSASYAPTPELRTLLFDARLQSDCARFLALNDAPDTRDTLVRLFLSFAHGASLRSWCLTNARLLSGVDVRRLVVFGLLHGLVYRMHKYALAAGRDGQDAAVRDVPAPGLARYLNGVRSFDSSCTELQVSEKELLARLGRDGNVCVVQH